MIDEEEIRNIRMLIGKTITDVHFFEQNPDKTVVKLLTSDGDIFSIDCEGSDAYVTVKPYMSIGE